MLAVNLLKGGLSKAEIEVPIELIAAGDLGKIPGIYNPSRLRHGPTSSLPRAGRRRRALQEIAGWKELVEDTRINESVRRLAIHEKLAAAGQSHTGRREEVALQGCACRGPR